jgi:hypothetical protein
VYESEPAPYGYKEMERQHPRPVHVVSKKHVRVAVLACSVNLGGGDQNEKQKPTMTETVTADQKLSPSDEKTHAIASKFQALTLIVLAPAASQTMSCEEAPQPLSCRWPAPQTYSTPATPQAYSAPASPHSGNASFGEQIWDMGVVEKVEEAVTSLLRNESSKYSTAANSATNTQISANACSAAKS